MQFSGFKYAQLRGIFEHKSILGFSRLLFKNKVVLYKKKRK